MKKSYFSLLIVTLFTLPLAYGQMIDGSSTKYGNEWIDHSKSYYKIPIAEDAVYKLSYQALLDGGFAAGDLLGQDFRMYEYGEEIPIYTTTDGVFGSDDYILFYGKQNRGQIDKYLYEEADKQLNPDYSLYTDTLNYFLSLFPGKINKRLAIQENDLSGNLPFLEEFYWHEEKIVNFSDHFKPTYDGTNKVTYSHLDVPEGFASPMQQYNEYTLSVSNFYDVGEDPFLKFRLATSTSPHKTDVSINGEVIDNLYATGYTVSEELLEFDASLLDDELVVGFEGTDVTTSLIDRNTQAYVAVNYTRSFVFPGESEVKFTVEPSLLPKYFEIPALDVNQDNVRLIDLSNGFILTPEFDQATGNIRFLIPPSDSSRELLIFNLESSPVEAKVDTEVSFEDYSQLDEEYIIISNSALFEEYNGENQVAAYADYRGSDQGGQYNTLIVDVQQIFDQFGYGLHRHSQSLNNFINYINALWTEPKMIFIIGKGRDYIETRTHEQLADPANLFYVPTYGFHGADVLMAAPKGEYSPGIPIGRIAVKSTEQIAEYLEKVKQHENYLKYAQTLEEKEWMKKVIHLSGGDSNIQELLRNYLDEMGDVLANNSFGANVVTYGRTSGTATEAVTEKIVEDINDGCSMITFFGHSGVSGSDFNIGDLENDKFPLFVSLGCYSGDIHTNITTGQSEKFVLSPHGVIAFLGAAGTAYITPQYVMGKEFYNLIGGELYGKSIGQAIKAVLDLNKNNQSLSIKSLNEQLTLHGDPAIRLNPHDGPDYLCDYQTASTLPEVINSNESTFEFSFDVVNLGKWVDDSLGIRLVRAYPNGALDTTLVKIAGPKYRSKVTVELPSGNTDGIGQNCVYVSLDYDQRFEEKEAPAAENNNELVNDMGEAGYCFYIINNGAKPIYPAEFSIVNKEEVILKASTYNYFVETQRFVFQIDTTELYNSPLLTEHQASYDGGLLEWAPDLTFEEETVYYWRISPDTLDTGLGYLWSGSSFVYLPGSSEGWNQSHRYQYEKDDPQGINPVDWGFEFDNAYLSVELFNRKYDSSSPKFVYVNGEGWGSFNPRNYRPCLAIIGVGPKGFNAPTGNYGNLNGTDPYAFIFKTENIDQRKGIKSLLEDMPDSATVFVYTFLDDGINDLYPETWGEDSLSLGYNLFSVLESYGAQHVRKLETKGDVPYTFIFKKGGEVIDEKIGKDIDDEIESSVIASTKKNEGSFHSTIIGPSIEWKKLLWSHQLNTDTEFSFLTLTGIDKNLVSTVLKDSIQDVFDLDINWINADDYPFLKLSKYAKDSEDKSPSYLDYWRVLYDGLPDAVLVMDEYAEFYQDTLDFGDNFRFKATVLNNSSLDMDSLEVIYTVKKTNNELHSWTEKYAPLLANDTLHIHFELSTGDFAGTNEFTVEVNPDHDPEEQYYFNNIGIRRFYVGSDKENPILDVTFDGVHIMDGDIVSPKPEIHMLLKDENTFLLLNDPNLFTKINLLTPAGETIDIPIGSELLEFIPAENTADNVAQMIFRPELTEEGEYSLIVQAKDASNNTAGANEYQVDFQVILEEQISNVYNYPNPFSSNTQFVFTLTGYEVPQDLTIRIMTLSGKVVKEITRDELGPLRIGNNITEYRWDGRDDYGDKLGNGVYLYQVKARNSNGEDYDLMETNSENDARFFKKGWGKMAILR